MFLDETWCIFQLKTIFSLNTSAFEADTSRLRNSILFIYLQNVWWDINLCGLFNDKAIYV